MQKKIWFVKLTTFSKKKTKKLVIKNNIFYILVGFRFFHIEAIHAYFLFLRMVGLLLAYPHSKIKLPHKK